MVKTNLEKYRKGWDNWHSTELQRRMDNLYDNFKDNLGEDAEILGQVTEIAGKRGYSHFKRLEKIKQKLERQELSNIGIQYKNDFLKVYQDYLQERKNLKSGKVKLKRKVKDFSNLTKEIRELKQESTGFLQYVENEKQLEDRLNNYEDNLEDNNQNDDYNEQPQQSRIIEMPDKNTRDNNQKRGLLKKAGRWVVGAAAALLIMASPVGSRDVYDISGNMKRSEKASVISVYENLGQEIRELKKELRQAGLPDNEVRERIKEKYEKKIKDIREKLGLPDEQVRREARKGMISEERYENLEKEYSDYRTVVGDLLEQRTEKLQETRQDNEELEKDYRGLQKEHGQLEQENDVLVDEYGKLAQENQELEQENDGIEGEFKRLQGKYHKEAKEFAEYKAETQGNIERLRQGKQELRQENEVLEKQNKGLEQRLVRAGLPDGEVREQTRQKVMKKANQRYEELEAEFNKLKDKYEQENLEFQEFRKVAGEYKQNTQEEIRDLREDFGQATEQNQELEQQLVDSRTELEQEIEERGLPDDEVREQTRQKVMKKANQRYEELEEKHDGLEKDYRELRKENGVLELEYGDLQTEYAEQGREFLDYKKQAQDNLGNLKLRNQGLRQGKQELEKDNEVLEQKLVIAGKPDEHVREQAIKDARKGMVKKEEYDELIQEHESLAQENQGLIDEYGKLAQNNQELEQETLILKDTAKEFSNRYESTIKEFSDYRKQKTKLLEDKAEKLAEIRQENQELEGEYEKLQREDNLLRISYNKLQQKYDKNVEDFEEFIRKSMSKTKELKQNNQELEKDNEVLEQKLVIAGKPDEHVWKETAQAMQDRYEPKIQKLKDENQRALEKLQTTNQRLKRYQKLEQRRIRQEKEGMPIHKLVSNEIFKVPKFPLSWAVINEKEERFEQIHILEYNSQDGFGIIDTKQELSKLADSISKAYDPALTSNKAFETLIEITGADKKLGAELEQGKEIATNFDKLAEFLFAYQKSLEKEDKGKGIVPYRNKKGQLVVVGNHDNIIKLKQETK